MDYKKMFEAQSKLDARIIDRHNLQGKDLFEMKLLALQVELGELANEWRGFKFWSQNQNANGEQICPNCEGDRTYLAYAGTPEETSVNCEICDGEGTINPLLEEYVDCLHFVISIGNELKVCDYQGDRLSEKIIEGLGVQKTLMGLMSKPIEIVNELSEKPLKAYQQVLQGVLTLGKMLGFTESEIEQAYYEKNKENHRRQEVGY